MEYEKHPEQMIYPGAKVRCINALFGEPLEHGKIYEVGDIHDVVRHLHLQHAEKYPLLGLFQLIPIIINGRDVYGYYANRFQVVREKKHDIIDMFKEHGIKETVKVLQMQRAIAMTIDQRRHHATKWFIPHD